MALKEKVLNTSNLVSFWDFQEKSTEGYKAQGKHSCFLEEMVENIEMVQDGIFGESSLRFKEGDWLNIPRNKCGDLNIGGKDGEVTVIAWVKREKKSNNQCEAVAGMWNEENKQRQYCLFLNLSIHDGNQQVCGHISSVGGPTPGQRWCMDASIGSTEVELGNWHCIGFTYDRTHIKSYLDGVLDERETMNPYFYPEGIFLGDENGSNFTVGGVYRLGEMGNWFTGLLGGLAVYDRALTAEEMKDIMNV